MTMIPAGGRIKDMILIVDFAATLSDFAGVQAPEGSQGHSFKEILTTGNTPKDWRKNIYYRYWTHHSIRPAHIGVRTDRYKLIFLYGDPLTMTGSEAAPTEPTWEFYDLLKDPKEDHNAYNDTEYRTVIRDVKKRDDAAQTRNRRHRQRLSPHGCITEAGGSPVIPHPTQHARYS